MRLRLLFFLDLYTPLLGILSTQCPLVYLPASRKHTCPRMPSLYKRLQALGPWVRPQGSLRPDSLAKGRARTSLKVEPKPSFHTPRPPAPTSSLTSQLSQKAFGLDGSLKVIKKKKHPS